MRTTRDRTKTNEVYLSALNSIYELSQKSVSDTVDIVGLLKKHHVSVIIHTALKRMSLLDSYNRLTQKPSVDMVLAVKKNIKVMAKESHLATGNNSHAKITKSTVELALYKFDKAISEKKSLREIKSIVKMPGNFYKSLIYANILVIAGNGDWDGFRHQQAFEAGTVGLIMKYMKTKPWKIVDKNTNDNDSKDYVTRAEVKSIVIEIVESIFGKINLQ